MKDAVGIYYGCLVYLTAVCLFWPFGMFYGHLVYFTVLVCYTKKNLATLLLPLFSRIYFRTSTYVGSGDETWRMWPVNFMPGPNPTIVSYNASDAKKLQPTSSLVRLKTKMFSLLWWKRSNLLLQRWRCSCNFRRRRIGSMSRMPLWTMKPLQCKISFIFTTWREFESTISCFWELHSANFLSIFLAYP
jgi:hypothetical protein